MVSVLEEEIDFGTFQVLLDGINVQNILKLKLAHIRGFNLFIFLTPKKLILV